MTLQVAGEAQVLHPVKSFPPHCCHCALLQPDAWVVVGTADVTTVELALVADVVVIRVELALVADDVVTGLVPPPLVPQEKTAGPGMT
jgi:hypothetical protein